MVGRIGPSLLRSLRRTISGTDYTMLTLPQDTKPPAKSAGDANGSSLVGGRAQESHLLKRLWVFYEGSGVRLMTFFQPSGPQSRGKIVRSGDTPKPSAGTSPCTFFILVLFGPPSTEKDRRQFQEPKDALGLPARGPSPSAHQCTSEVSVRLQAFPVHDLCGMITMRFLCSLPGFSL